MCHTTDEANTKPDQGAQDQSIVELLDEAWRSVACAKLNEYRRQCRRLFNLARRGEVPFQDAVDRLWLIADAHAFTRWYGKDGVEAIIAQAYADAMVEAAA
jgi:hypothetical protein